MQIGITNFLGIRKLIHDTGDTAEGQLVRIVANNAQGKTSAMVALGCCLTENDNPRKIPKSRAVSVYAYNAASNSKAVLKLSDFFRVEVKPGKGVARTINPAFEINPEVAKVCAGFSDVLEWREKDWGKLFDKVGIAENDFIAAVYQQMGDWTLTGDAEKDSATAEWQAAADAYRRMAQAGVDAAIEYYDGIARDSKRDWKNAVAQAGESANYGTAVAASWYPQGWLPEWEKMSDESVSAEVAAAQAAADKLKMTAAYSAGEVAEARKKAAKLDAHKKTVEAAAEMERDATKAYADAVDAQNKRSEEIRGCEKQLADLRAQYQQLVDIPKCPHCDKPFIMKSGKPEVVAEIDKSKAEIAAKGKELKTKLSALSSDAAAASAQIKDIKAKMDGLANEHRKASGELADAAVAADIVAKAEQAAPPEQREKQINEAEQKVTQAREMQNKIHAWRKANAAHFSVKRYSGIAAALKPGGTVSAKLSQKGMGELEKWLKYLSSYFGHKVQILDGIALFGKEERIADAQCSGSEKWICAAIIQIGVACAFFSPLVLLDGVDILDDKRLEAFVKDLRGWGKMTDIKRKPSIIVAGTTRPGFYDQFSADIVLEDGSVAEN